MDRHPSSSLGTPAPYGRACASCAQSKCKCIIRPAGGPCGRCFRLNRECRPAESARRRNPRKSVVTKKARLEEKLDDLVSLVKAGALGGSVTTSSQTTPSTQDSLPYSPIQINSNTSTPSQSERSSLKSGLNDYAPNVPALTPAYTHYTYSSSEPSPEDAEGYLANFKTYQSRYFPFVYIPPTTSAQQLRQQRPFLWLCLVMVGSKSTSQQQALGQRIRETIAQEMVVQSARNIDLLLGLLAFIGWANYQFHGQPFLATFTQLAMSLVFDLGLNKPVPKDAQVNLCMNQKCLKPITPRTMEERRAVLGCFLISSIISSFLQKIDALRWTSHMDECLQILDEKKECSNDEILAQQVRLQLVVEKMALDMSCGGTAVSSSHTNSTSLYLESLQSQLQDVKMSLPTRFQDNEVILLHLYSTKLEITLSPAFLHTNQITFKQRNVLITGLESIKSWFEVFFTIRPADYIGFPFSIFTQLVRCLTTLYLLKSLDVLEWDEDDSWKPTDPLLILTRVINNMDQVATVTGLDASGSPEGDVFSRAAQLFRSLQPGWEAKLRTNGLALSTLPTQQSIEETSLPDSLGLDFLDNDWLAELFLPPNY